MRVKTLALSSVFIGAIVLLTMWPTFPILLVGGYFNFGDVLVMSMGYTLGFPFAALAGVGAALADLLLGWGQYALFTLIIKGIEASIIVFFVKQDKIPFYAYLLAGIWMAAGYGLTDAFLSSNLAMFIPSFSANIVQGLICAGLAFSVLPLFKRLKKSYF